MLDGIKTNNNGKVCVVLYHLLLFPLSNLVIFSEQCPVLESTCDVWQSNFKECTQVSAGLGNSPVLLVSVTIFSSSKRYCAARALTGMRPSECRQWTCASCQESQHLYIFIVQNITSGTFPRRPDFNTGLTIPLKWNDLLIFVPVNWNLKGQVGN